MGHSSRMLMMVPIMAIILLATIPQVSGAEEVYVIANEHVDVYIEPDGSADIRYDLRITVRPHSEMVTTLLLHMPNWRFEADDVDVTLDGEKVSDVRKAPDDDKAMEIFFNSAETLQPGTTHDIIIVTNVDAMVVKSPEDPRKARLSFTPTWWDPGKVQEVQNLEVRIHLPEGFEDEDRVDHSGSPTITQIGGRIVLIWQDEDLNADFHRTYRTDFPSSIMDALHDPFWDIFLPYYAPWFGLVLVVVVVGVAAFGARRLLREPYIKPYMKTEAWGAKKDLGPYDVAILLGRKPERIARMFLVELMMVGVVERTGERDELELDTVNPDYMGRSASFLESIRGGRVDPISSFNLIATMGDELDARIGGHDVDETVSHYETLVEQKWERARKGTKQEIDEVLWLMVHPRAGNKFREKRFKEVPKWYEWDLGL